MVRNGFVALAGALLVLVAATACSDDAEKSPRSGNSSAAGDQADSGRTDAGTTDRTDAPDNGRAFDSGDEAVETALKSALDATKVEFGGKEVRVHMPSGSATDPTAGLYCSSVTAVIADDERAFLVYSDGEYDCGDRS